MVKRFRQEWAAISAQPSDPPERALEQTLTLASLVERETPKPDERPLVAGVFATVCARAFPCSATHGRLRSGAGGTIQRHARGQRDPIRFALQHLSPRGFAAGPSRIPARHRCARLVSRANRLPIFRN